VTEDEAFTKALYERLKTSLSLPWEPHEGPPHMTPDEALRLYREKRSEALSRTVMTEEQRANFVGDAK